jgi:outer membrane protein assembly factor BamA
VNKLKHKALTAILAVSCLCHLQAQKDSLQPRKADLPPEKNQVQKKVFLKVINVDSVSTKGFVMPDYQRVANSSSECMLEIKKLLDAVHDESYLTATVDSVRKDSNKITAFLTPGKPYQWAYLRKGNVDEVAINMSGFREKMFDKKPFYFKTASKLLSKILNYYEDHGFPFVKLLLDSISVKENTISASIRVIKNRTETIDSVVINGTLKLSAKYLYGYLGIKPGDLYDESKVEQIGTRLKALPFLSVARPLQVVFIQGKAKIVLYLNKKSADQANGIIGILPNTNGKITLTGDVNLQLQNAFHRDDELGFHWQHLQPLTENLTINFSYPYLFQTPIGIDEKFKLFKQDTTYLQIDNKFGLKYLFIGGDYLEVFYESIVTSLLSTAGLQDITALPPYTDATTDLYGLEYKLRHLDYIYNPRRGYELLGSVAVGNKTIRENAAVNPVVYQGLQLNTIEYRGILTSDCYIPVAGRACIKFGLNGGYIEDPSLLLNDLFRIGGLEILRGFNEQSIYVSQYAVGTVEFHYLLEQNSYLFVFYDQGWVRETLASSVQYFTDTPSGYGAGMDFQTKAGIFSLAYALGNGMGNPLNFSTGKITFGIVSYF